MSTRWWRSLRRWSGHRRRDEGGYAVVMTATLVASGLFLGCAAIGVDTARWYAEIQKVQKAADAAALAGVPFLPYDLPNAIQRAKEVAARNGYDDAAPGVVVTVERGGLPSQLKVTVSSTIDNAFGGAIGIPTATMTRTAMADYQGPSPMGSPCNTFGNEPSSGAGPSSPTPAGTARGATPFPNCATSNPQFWATIEGPQVPKDQGDRYQTRTCGSGTDGCTGSTNAEYEPTGYFFIVKVLAAAVGQPVTVQLYDPAYVETGSTCSSMAGPGSFDDNMNPFVTTDGKARYSSSGTASGTGAPFCTGDLRAGSGANLMTTSFVLRQQNDSLDPMVGAPVSGCTKQYTGRTSAPSVNSLKSSTGSYNEHLAEVFHNWTALCTFTPTRSGDYYLQVRSNVAPGGSFVTNTNGNSAIIYSGNTAAGAATGSYNTGTGNNAFGIRAVTTAGLEQSVAVSGYDRMPIFANADSASSTFNLVKVLPAAAGRFIEFSFFDAADISGTTGGTVRVFPPTDATGTFTQPCTAVGGAAGSSAVTLTDCTAPVNRASNNGRVETMTIPVPADYNCNDASPGGCWFQVTISFPGATVQDVTTWNATVIGDPVRLVE